MNKKLLNSRFEEMLLERGLGQVVKGFNLFDRQHPKILGETFVDRFGVRINIYLGSHMSEEEVLLTIDHELAHAEQFKSGDLTVGRFRTLMFRGSKADNFGHNQPQESDIK
jgi:hypothetical protein